MKNQLHQQISFGTDGIRGRADEYPFTQQALFAFGRALGAWICQKYQTTKLPGVLIGHDTRTSCDFIKKELLSGFSSSPITIFDGGIIPTPAVCQLIQADKQFNVGIVISASHNPYYDNGIKIFDAHKSKITKEDESTIIHLFEKYTEEQQEHATQRAQVTLWPEARSNYEKNILSYFPANFLQGLTIALDCANGATYQCAPEIFRALGATVVTTAAEPSGTNINVNCGSLHPETIRQFVLQHHADIGFAFDGDGDRVIMVNKHGLIKNGDDTLYLLLSLPEFKNLETIVGTVMSNQGLEEALKKSNKKLIRTKVGDKYVAQEMTKQHVLLGGEISGHTIIKNYLSTSDGTFIALKVLQVIIATKNWGLETFTPYPQLLVNVPVKNKKPLDHQPYANIIAHHEALLKNGRILVRYSGTENILRVMTEAENQEQVVTVAQKLANELKKALDG